MGQLIDQYARKLGHTVVGIRQREALPLDEWLRLQQPADVAIEFTTPEAAFDNITACIRAGIPVVSGTTGWHQRLPEAETLCRELDGTLLVASNFSLGVNLLFELNRWLSSKMATLKEYQVTVLESHHTAKKDMPSGTAITLASDLAQALQLNGWQLNTVQDPQAVPIFASRVPGEVGRHQILWTSGCDQIVLEHKAFSREGFALGALRAAEYIAGKKGVFTMRQVLGFSD
jgi:4-hydroxy-tetrahydrodipicolinate reductase